MRPSLTWTAASDDVTPASTIVYDVCVSRTSGSCASNFLVTDTTDLDATLWNVGNLKQGYNYYFLVRARDQAGNGDDNMIELQAQPKLPSAQRSLAVGGAHTCTRSEPFLASAASVSSAVSVRNPERTRPDRGDAGEIEVFPSQER